MRTLLPVALFLCSVFFHSSVYSQKQLVAFSGTVTDESGVLLQGIHISLDGAGYHAITDHAGKFVLDQIKSGRYTLTASGIGYQTLKETVTVATDMAAPVLKMKVQAYPVPTVEILASIR